ncbi:MAG: heme lyase CcmF/NrfE family subunit [Proteobacteria bacterium]|nr:heme lyase CcmF/NrfE family subunit [Pseudomonadota bacterium]
MINIGLIFLNSALMTLSLVISIIVLNNRNINNLKLLKIGTQASAVLLSVAFLWLIYSFYLSDFSLLLVYNNSHTLKPTLYKITGTWGNHEGSFLMFIFMLAYINYRITVNKLFIKSDILYYTLLFNNIILLLVVIYSRFTSNPFEMIWPVPPNGAGLNPLLQDIGLALHPPILYTGYVCMSVVFSSSLAALWLQKMPPEWVSFTKKWALLGLAFLTCGIGMGSWWAYRELGWGGFWFWDPVENSSLFPWLSAIAFVHALLVVEKRGTLKCWTLFLGILTFSLSLTGFFLVRSGVLSSVHSFASDPLRGLFILLIMVIVVGFALFLFSLRSRHFLSKASYRLVSREGAIMINNLVLVVLCATVFMGVIYPILLETFTGQHVSVGAPYFNTLVNPIACALLVLAAAAPSVMWKQEAFSQVIAREQKSIIVAVLAFSFMTTLTHAKHVLASFAVASSVWLLCSLIRMANMHLQKYRASSNKPLARFFPPRILGMLLAHAGLALLVLSIAICSIYEKDAEGQLALGEHLELAGYTVTLKNVTEGMAKNYLYERGEFAVSSEGSHYASLYPERRVYPVEKDTTTESALHYGVFADVYAVIGEPMRDGKHAVKLFYRPMVSWIWLSCCLIALGLLCSLYGHATVKTLKKK